MPLKLSKEEVISNFEKLPDDPSKVCKENIWSASSFLTLQEILEKFLSENFDKEGTELEEIVPTDWQENPDLIDKIQDDGLKKLAIEMNRIWKKLTRKFSKGKHEIEAKSSLIYLENPFVVPGGRFREEFKKYSLLLP